MQVRLLSAVCLQPAMEASPQHSTAYTTHLAVPSHAHMLMCHSKHMTVRTACRSCLPTAMGLLLPQQHCCICQIIINITLHDSRGFLEHKATMPPKVSVSPFSVSLLQRHFHSVTFLTATAMRPLPHYNPTAADQHAACCDAVFTLFPGLPCTPATPQGTAQARQPPALQTTRGRWTVYHVHGEWGPVEGCGPRVAGCQACI